MNWNDLKYFKQREFDSPDVPGSGANMTLAFVYKLEAIRDMVGEPLKINSGYRTAAHNKKVGGVATSAHMKGVAVDIRVTSNELRAKIIRAAIKNNIGRIGIGRTIVHLDSSTSLPTPRLWLYP